MLRQWSVARLQADLGALEASAERARAALGCIYSSSNEFEAAAIRARQAVNLVSGLDSSRTVRFLGQFRGSVQPHVGASDEARDFADAYVDVFASGR